VDWWSLGVVACELLTGELPFDVEEDKPTKEVLQ
jgi:serine/threonine protein kinase